MAAAKKKSSSKKGAGALPPRTFFEKACPRILDVMRTTCVELGGKYTIEVTGDEGGAWTLDYPAAQVRAGKDAAADLYVTLTPEQFAGVSTGKEELAKLVADGRAPSTGDAKRVENLSFVLAFLQRG
jgi:hypothetical protein